MENIEKLVGRVLDDRYQLKSLAGDGASAVVFAADDLLLRRRVAIKMLRTEPLIAQDPSETEAERLTRVNEGRRLARESFRREALAASRLSHPNIVTIYDVSPVCENPYIVMEYVEGETLADRLARGKMSLREQLFVTHGVLEALAEAHEHGVYHRDIKPQNILLTATGAVKVTDFGIADMAGRSTLSLGDRVLGTADTISPEQAKGQKVDGRSDLYSLGAVMYRMATGHYPFEDEDPDVVASKHVSMPPKDPLTWDPCVPKGLAQLIMNALEKEPGKRAGRAVTMLRAVEALEKDPHRTFRRFSTRTGETFFHAVARRSYLTGTIAGILLAAVAVTLVVVFSGSRSLSDVTVIDLENYTGTVCASGDALGLDGRVTVVLQKEYRPDLPEGTVLSQSPAAGTLWKLDGPEDTVTLILTVSTQIPK